MEYKKGFDIKPDEIRSDGRVFFTDGTNTFMPNQLACEAYGYIYDSQLGICKAYDYTPQLARTNKQDKVEVKGTNNTTERGVRDTIITGKDNVSKGDNTNNIICGKNNEIERAMNNGLVLGKFGQINHNSEFCIGGGGFGSHVGTLQYSILQLSGKTTSNAAYTLSLESNDFLAEKIKLPANSITTYEIWLSGLVTGGTSGTIGDYETMEYHGAILTKNDGTMTHNAKISRLLGRTGSLGTKTIQTDEYQLNMSVVGQNNVNTQWHAVVKLHINKTVVAEIT